MQSVYCTLGRCLLGKWADPTPKFKQNRLIGVERTSLSGNRDGFTGSYECCQTGLPQFKDPFGVGSALYASCLRLISR